MKSMTYIVSLVFPGVNGSLLLIYSFSDITQKYVISVVFIIYVTSDYILSLSSTFLSGGGNKTSYMFII